MCLQETVFSLHSKCDVLNPGYSGTLLCGYWCVRVHIYTCACVYICTCVRLKLYTYVRMQTFYILCWHGCTMVTILYVCLFARLHVCKFVMIFIYTFVWLNVCIYVTRPNTR